jgi:hypothetical protein
MTKPSADRAVVIVQRAFLHPQTREPVSIGDAYRTTAQNAADMISLSHARAPTRDELAGYNRRDMRARD